MSSKTKTESDETLLIGVVGLIIGLVMGMMVGGNGQLGQGFLTQSGFDERSLGGETPTVNKQSKKLDLWENQCDALEGSWYYNETYKTGRCILEAGVFHFDEDGNITGAYDG